MKYRPFGLIWLGKIFTLLLQKILYEGNKWKNKYLWRNKNERSRGTNLLFIMEIGVKSQTESIQGKNW
jgi:hypothetical protein